MAETFVVVDAAGLKPTIVKDPNATLDYTWDWTGWLEDAADSIEGTPVVTTTGSVALVGSPIVTEGKVTAFLSGGKAGKTESATCRIVTEGGRVDERSIYLKLRER